jgi:hypothetical protein
MLLEGLDQLKKIHLIRTRTRYLPACSILPQPTTLPHAPPPPLWEDNTKFDRKEAVSGNVDWLHLARIGTRGGLL